MRSLGNTERRRSSSSSSSSTRRKEIWQLANFSEERASYIVALTPGISCTIPSFHQTPTCNKWHRLPLSDTGTHRDHAYVIPSIAIPISTILSLDLKWSVSLASVFWDGLHSERSRVNG